VVLFLGGRSGTASLVASYATRAVTRTSYREQVRELEGSLLTFDFDTFSATPIFLISRLASLRVARDLDPERVFATLRA
jgi:hypothetical protein